MKSRACSEVCLCCMYIALAAFAVLSVAVSVLSLLWNAWFYQVLWWALETWVLGEVS